MAEVLGPRRGLHLTCKAPPERMYTYIYIRRHLSARPEQRDDTLDLGDGRLVHGGVGLHLVLTAGHEAEDVPVE